MAINLKAWRAIPARINQQPRWLLIPLAIVAVAYVGWIGWRQWFDRPLPPSTVAARQLRVDQATSQALRQRLESYRQVE